MVRGERPPQLATSSIEVTGLTLNGLLEDAMAKLDGFFGDRRFYEITDVRARPAAQTVTGEILLWEAEVEAAQVWG